MTLLLLFLLADAGGKQCLCGCADAYYRFPPATHRYEQESLRRWPMLRGECVRRKDA